MDPRVLAVLAGAACVYFASVGVVRGSKWVGHEVKRGAIAVDHAVVHVVHPHKKGTAAKRALPKRDAFPK